MDEKSTISIGEAYKAMFEFVDAYWRRGGQTDDQIASMLGSMQYGDKNGPSRTIDPSQWSDWLDAIKKVQS